MLRYGILCTLAILIAIAAALIAIQTASAHVDEDLGEALQLYSGWCTTPPTLDGEIASIGNPAEWEAAFVRKITLVRASDNYIDPNPAYLFLMNDANFLYVGVTYYHTNVGDPNSIRLYFDEGAAGGDHNGTGNHGLTADNENAIGAYRTELTFPKWDKYWDGSAWVDDVDGIDYTYSSGYYTNVYNWEFAIPLDNSAESTDDLNNINGGDGLVHGDDIGFLLEVWKNGTPSEGMYYWDKTNYNTDDASGWADVRLGKPRSFVTFGATKNVKGNPTVDGSISENAYIGAYKRNITLTNFEGSSHEATLYFVQDAANDHIYVGVKVYDTVYSTNDYCQIYQEQRNAFFTADRDYVLNDERENALKVQENVLSDFCYENPGGSDMGLWEADVDGVETQLGTSTYDNTNNLWEYEFRISYIAGFDVNIQDLICTDTALIGFLVRYHDDDQPAGEQEFWWDCAANSDSEFINDSANLNLSTGWAYLQLGAPLTQIIHPEDNIILEGTYPIDVYVEPQTGIQVNKVEYQYAGAAISQWIALDQIGTTNWWSKNWDTTEITDGDYEVRVRVTYAGASEVVQIINITINNEETVSTPPAVTVTAPAEGSVVNGAETITFDVDPDSSLTIVDTEISIDGSAWTNVTTAPSADPWDDGSHTWTTNSELNGSHIFRVRAQDSGGQWGYSEARLVVVSNNISTTITSPTASSVINGVQTVTFNIDPETNETITSTQFSINGGTWTDVSNAPTSGGNWDDGSHIIDTRTMTNGSHSIQIKASDSNSHTGYSKIIILVVSNEVNVTITAPTAGSVIAGANTVTFNIDPETNETITSTQFSINGGT
ncbi:MAG: hypothetical protein ABH833_03895, partial [Parcubacteria group bacterium]